MEPIQPENQVSPEDQYPLSIQGKIKRNKKISLVVLGIFIVDLLLGGITLYNLSDSGPSSKSTKIDSKIPTPTQSLVPTTLPTIAVTQTPPPSPTSLIQPTTTHAPTVTPDSFDKEAPRTNIIQPSEGATSNYRVNGQVCAALGAPSDNVTPAGDIETRYKFDDGGWSSYERIVANACAPIENGPHTFYVQSKDKAGNEEVIQTRQFTAVD